MSSTEDFTNDTSIMTGGNNALRQAPLAQWHHNYYAPGQPAPSVALPLTHFNNHFDVNPPFNFNGNFIGNLNNTSAYNAFNHYTALRLAQSAHPYLGQVRDMPMPFGQMYQNEYYATPSFGISDSLIPQSMPRFTQPQNSVIPSTESWEVAPTTPVISTVRLETISPDVLRGRYTRPVESDFQPFAQTTNYDSSYRHFELDEHEHELSVPPQPYDGGRGQPSQTPAVEEEELAHHVGCFAQCGNDTDEDSMIGCRNGSCVVAFHPGCVKLGARDDGLAACPSCLSVVDFTLLGQLDRTTRSYSPTPQSESARSTHSPPRATPAPSVGSSFHPSPSPAATKRHTPHKPIIKIEVDSPPPATELFGSYKGSIAVPEGFNSGRGLNSKGAWTAEEDAACIRVMRNLLEIHNGSRRIAIDTLWQRASEALASEGIDRSSSGIKMQWTRRLRAQSGVDERAVPRPDLLRTGLLTKGVPRRKRVLEITPPPTPTTRRATKKLRGSAAETSHLTVTHVKNSRIVKLKIGAGTGTTTTGGRRGRGGSRKAKAKAQKKIEKFEDDVSPITEDPDEGISMHGRVTPGPHQEMEINMDVDMQGYNGSPTSSFEDALEDTLMDRGYVMEE